VKAVSLLASPWSALHRTRERIEAATFGTFDGATSSCDGGRDITLQVPDGNGPTLVT
jgi:hypothetical protein